MLQVTPINSLRVGRRQDGSWQSFLSHLSLELDALKRASTSPSASSPPCSGPRSRCGGETVLNFCANNYLGLADSDALRDAAKDALDRYGYGMASVRFICGTQEEHKQLERTIA